MKIAILTSGILPVPAVQGGAVETLIDHYLEYNDVHRLHDITVFSVGHPKVKECPQLQSAVNHYQYVDMCGLMARMKKRMHGFMHRRTYYHYSIDYYFQQVLKDIKRQHFDVIILENRPGYALQLKDATKAKLVYHLHNDFLNDATPQGSEIYRAATKILAVSEYIKGRVQTCCHADKKCVAVHNGIDLTAFSSATSLTREALGFDKDDFILVFSGRLVAEKGIVELVEALNILADEPRIKLLVMGSPFYGNAANTGSFIDGLRKAAEKVGDRIKFTGYIRHEQMSDYLKLADVAVIPSTWEEPFGLTVIEGMAAGLPVITTNRGGIPEIVTKDNAIVLPLPGDLTGNLTKAILTLSKDQQLRQRMGEASELLSKQYSKEVYAKNFFDAIEVL